MTLPRPASRLVVDGIVETVYAPDAAPTAAEVIAAGRLPKPAPAVEEIRPRCPCRAIEGGCDGSCSAGFY